jgi:hypothetical protein
VVPVGGRFFVVVLKARFKFKGKQGKKEENHETRESADQRGGSNIVPAHRYSMYAVRDAH